MGHLFFSMAFLHHNKWLKYHSNELAFLAKFVSWIKTDSYCMLYFEEFAWPQVVIAIGRV
jgi:hypothetical protein